MVKAKETQAPAKKKLGRPKAPGVVMQIRVPEKLKDQVAVSSEALETTMSRLIAVCLSRLDRTEGLSVAYLRELGERVEL